MSRRTMVTLTVSLGVFMASLDLFIVNIAFPDIQRDFAGTSPQLALLGPQRLRDRVRRAARPRRPLGRPRRAQAGFLGGLALFSVASAACAAAPRSRSSSAPGSSRRSAPRSCSRPRSGCCCPSSRPRSAGRRSASGPRSAASPRRPGRRSAGCSSRPDGGGCSSSTSRSACSTLIAGARLLTRSTTGAAPARPARAPALITAGIAALTLAIVKGPAWGWGGGRVLGLFAAAAADAGARSRCAAPGIRSPLIEPVIVRDPRDRAGQPRRAAVLLRLRR